MRNHEIHTQSPEESAAVTKKRVYLIVKLSSDIYKVSSRESGLTQNAKKLLGHVIFVSAFSELIRETI